MGIEFNSDANSEVYFTGPDVKEEESRDNLHNEILGVSAEKYEELQVELEECRNLIAELKLNHDEEKAGKEQTFKTLATYVKKIRDDRKQYVQQINSLENIVMMLKLKAKNSADHASWLEERLQELKTENEQLQSHCDFMMNILIEGDYEMNTGQTNKVTSSKNPTVSRNTAVKPYSSHSEQVNTSFSFDFNSLVGTINYYNKSSAEVKLEITSTPRSSSFLSLNEPSALVRVVSSGTNPSVATIIFETKPNFNFINQIPTQGQIFRFSADTSNMGVLRTKQRNFLIFLLAKLKKL